MNGTPCPRVAATLLLVALVAVVATPVAAQSSPDDWPMLHRTPDRQASFGPTGGTGELLWTHETVRPAGRGSVAVAGDTAYFGTRSGLHAVDRITGDERWLANVWGAVHSTPAIVDGVVYVGTWTASGNLTAVDAETGEMLWGTKIGDRVFSSPAVVGDTVYGGSSIGGTQDAPASGRIVALDAGTGSPIWTVETQGLVRSSPAVVGGTVYVGAGSGSNTVFAIDASSGEIEWRFPTLGAVATSPAVVDDRVYVASCFGGCDDGRNGTLHALDADDGLQVWSVNLTGPPRAPIVHGDDALHFGLEDGSVWTVDVTDDEPQVRWVRATINSILGGPAYADGTVYQPATDHRVWALDAETGNVTWSYDHGDAIPTSPAVVDGRLYAKADNGLIALDAGAGVAGDDGSDGGPTDLFALPGAGPGLLAAVLAVAAWGMRRR